MRNETHQDNYPAMPSRPVTIFLSAAEASGDEHAARLIDALRRRLPEARFVGAAGPRMAEAGCEVLMDFTRHASMLGGPILRFPYWYRHVRRLQKAILQIRPDVHVPVDSPALNWHLAAASKKAGIPVVYYIAPQVWAWAPWRVRKLARLTDRVACILPFEEAYLRHRQVNATYVGHPLFDTLPQRPSPLPDIIQAWSNGQWRVALLPGSRQGELAAHAKALFATAKAICRHWPQATCTFPVRTEENAEFLRKLAKEPLPQQIQIAVGRTREVLAESHFAVAVSGTVTLEVAHYGVPMIVFYRATRLGYTIARWLIHTPHLSLANILAGHRVVPEMMPWYGSAPKLTKMVMEVMTDLGCLCDIRKDLLQIVQPLRAAPPGTASDNAADIVIKTLADRAESPHA